MKKSPEYSNKMLRLLNKFTLFKNINELNNNKLLIGVSLILINIGSKYVEMNFSKTQEEALRNGLGRELLLFAILFIGTRDILIAFFLTIIFMLLSNYLFNENCKYCLIPNSLRKINSLIDKNKEGMVTPDEEKKALETLNRVADQKKYKQQAEFLKYLKSNNEQ